MSDREKLVQELAEILRGLTPESISRLAEIVEALKAPHNQ